MNGYFAAPTDLLGNTAVGNGALISDIGSGFFNTALGNDALQNDNSGTFNTASGYQALQNNTTGDFNTALWLPSAGC